MTFRRKLLLGFSLMALPTLLVSVAALRSNVQERRALEALGESMARTRTYAELETAMFNQSEVVWRYLSGMDPTARDEFRLAGQVVDYWQTRWRSELAPEELQLSDRVQGIQREIRAVGHEVFARYDAGDRAAAFALAERRLRDELLPALTQLNRQTYRQARESSVRGAFARLEEILEDEGGTLVATSLLAAATGLVASWLIARGLARPVGELTEAMAVVGAGNLDHPIGVRSRDEIGRVAVAFRGMTEQLRDSRTELLRVNAELEAKVGQLERTQAQLIRSEKLASIGEMAAAVAHGLRNPLASLRATAQLARRHADADGARENLDLIIQEVDRLDRRITHLLGFSREAPFHPMQASVTRLVDELLPSFAELLRGRGIDLHLALPPDGAEVRMDPIQLEQALVEIVSNALDAMPSGGTLRIAVRAAATAVSTDASAVVVEIEDSGGGIPEHVLPSVCEPFFTTRADGTGLGLAIAKRYVEQNGGRIEIASEPGAGTRVSIHLPVAEAGGAAAAATVRRA